VGTGQHAVTHGDRTHGTGIAAVDTGLTSQDAATHDGRFQREEQVGHDTFVGSALAFTQSSDGLGLQLLDTLAAGLLAGDAIGFFQLGLDHAFQLGNEDFVAGRRLPVPLGLTGFFNQGVDGIDGGLHLLMAEHHGAKHDFFGQFLSFGFHHQHSGLGTGNHQVQLGVFHLRSIGAEHVLTVDVTDAGSTDRPLEGNTGDGQGGGGTDHRGDVRIHFRIQRHDRGHDLDFVVEAFGEQRADRAVDQARGEDFLFGGTAFTLEEAAGDLAGSVGLFLVIDGQGEEILAGFSILGSDNRDEDDGVVHRHHDGTGGLTGDFAGLDGHLMGAVGKSLLSNVEHETFLSRFYSFFQQLYRLGAGRILP